MPRKEQFAFGVALVTAALTIILAKSLAWLILIIGLGLVFDFYLRDLIWGPDRLTREQIEKMPAEEYKARVLGNPGTEGWVNWLASGRDAFKKHMRKLTRQAVISGLLGVLAAVPTYFIVYYGYGRSLWMPIDVPGYYEFFKSAYSINAAVFITNSMPVGFVVGVAIWCLYHLIRFALKG